jgi:hypothetical protein
MDKKAPKEINSKEGFEFKRLSLKTDVFRAFLK